VCVCSLNGVFLYFVSAISRAGLLPGAAFGSLVFTFSPPVSGFSFLVRGFNAQSSSIDGKIAVTTASGNVTTSVLTQTDGDINFIGWFQAGSSVISVAMSPLTFKFGSSTSFTLSMALDELRVYTQQITPTPPQPTASPLSPVGDDAPRSSDSTTIAIWTSVASFSFAAIVAVWCFHYRCCRRVEYNEVDDTTE